MCRASDSGNVGCEREGSERGARMSRERLGRCELGAIGEREGSENVVRATRAMWAGSERGASEERGCRASDSGDVSWER